MTQNIYTDNMLSILLYLYHNGEVSSQYSISKGLKISKQTVSNNIKKLREMNLVEDSDDCININPLFHNPVIKELWQDIMSKLYPLFELEGIISSDTHEIENTLRNIFKIIILLSQKQID